MEKAAKMMTVGELLFESLMDGFLKRGEIKNCVSLVNGEHPLVSEEEGEEGREDEYKYNTRHAFKQRSPEQMKDISIKVNVRSALIRFLEYRYGISEESRRTASALLDAFKKVRFINEQEGVHNLILVTPWYATVLNGPISDPIDFISWAMEEDEPIHVILYPEIKK